VSILRLRLIHEPETVSANTQHMASRIASQKRLGEESFRFMHAIVMAAKTGDGPAKAEAVAYFRSEVEFAARHGIEDVFSWLLLGKQTEDRQDRLRIFSRIIELLDEFAARGPFEDPYDVWANDAHRADCQYEIARVHAAEGKQREARCFLEQALVNARSATDHAGQGPAQFQDEDEQLEGRIAASLLLIDAEV